MLSDLNVVVATTARLPMIREGLRLTGRAMHFTSGNLASATESIRSHQPRLVAIEAPFAQTPAGVAFVERVEALAPDSDIRIIVQLEGRWVTAPRQAAPEVEATNLFVPQTVVFAAPKVVAPPAPIVVAPQVNALNTRRAPRFLLRSALDAVVENGSASLVDLSIHGAQVVSRPVLRPNQKIKIALPDTGEVLRVTAHVAWSTFEKPAVSDAHYRAGLEFTDAAQQAMENYRRRHCAEQPIPYRG